MNFIQQFKNLWRMPSAREMLVRQLEEAKREKTLASMHREAYQAHEAMLGKRIERISAELRSQEVAE